MAARVEFAPQSDDSAIADALEQLLGSGGDKTLAVPGGSTPFPIFAELARRDIDWSKVSFWLGDDRMVADDHPASNYGRLKAAFADKPATIVKLEQGITPPVFDMVWIGMGADGHIASLFPNIDPQTGTGKAVIRITPDPLPPEAPFDRLSLTLDALLDCKAMMLVAGGAEKRAVLDAALSGEHDLPIARLINAADTKLTIYWRET